MSDWKTRLLVTRTGAPRPLLANAITALREAPAWFGVLAYDEFSRETVIKAAPPWDIKLAPWSERVWSSHDDLLATEWLQRKAIAVNTQTTAQAVEAVARDRAFHPVVDYLSDLQHDGKSRVTTWLSSCLGADQTSYNETVGRAMLIAAVARIFDLGCKANAWPSPKPGSTNRSAYYVPGGRAPWNWMPHFFAIDACSTATICPFIWDSSAAVCLSPPTKNAAGQKMTIAAAVATPSLVR